MIYVKCILTGVGALFATSILYVYGYYVFLVRPRLPKAPPGKLIGIDARVFFGQPYFWLIALIAFAGGFCWKFRSY